MQLEITFTHQNSAANQAMLDRNNELWKPIIGFENSHHISTNGRVLSISRKVKSIGSSFRTTKTKILKPSITPRNYHSIMLKNKGKHYFIHRLVAMAFIPNPENKPCVNHINGNPSDNRIENLEWCTYSENELHSFRKLGKKPNKTNLGNTGILSASAKPLMAIDLNGNVYNVFGSSREAGRFFNGTETNINKVCSNKRNKAYGYSWKRISHEEYAKYSTLLKARIPVQKRIIEGRYKEYYL